MPTTKPLCILLSLSMLSGCASMGMGSGYVPISVVSLALVTAAVVLPAWGPLAWGPVQAVGRASYALYLWHIPMFWIGPVLAPSIDSRIRVIGGAAIAAALSRYLVVRPAARLRRRWG